MWYREKELQIQACEWPQCDDVEVHAGQSAIGDWKLDEEGEDGQEVCVDVVQRELHNHSTSPVNTRKHLNEWSS